MNDHQKLTFADNIAQAMYNIVSEKAIDLLGWPPKKDTRDTRQSAANYVADALFNGQAKIVVYISTVTAGQIYFDLYYLGTRRPGGERRRVTVVNGGTQCAHAVAGDWDRIKVHMMKPAFVPDRRYSHQIMKLEISNPNFILGEKFLTTNVL